MRALNVHCDFSGMLAGRYHLLRDGDIGNGLDDYFALTETLDLEYGNLPDERKRMVSAELDRLAQPLGEIIEEIQMIDLGGFVAVRKLDLLDSTADVARTLVRHLDKNWWRTIT